MRRALLILLAIVVLVPVAGILVARSILNEDALRTRIEAAVLKATGRTLTIAGPIHVGWSLTPTIDAADLSLANPPGFSRAAFTHVDRVRARVGLLKLLSHRLEITFLAIAGADVQLERDAQGRPNWEFARSAAPAGPPAPSSEPGQKLVLDVGEIALTDATLAFQAAQRVEIAAPGLTYDPASGRVAGDLVFRGASLHVTGAVQPPTLDLHLQGSGLDLAITGAMPTLTLDAAVANLASLSPLAGTNLPALREVRLGTRATFAPNALALDDLVLSSAQGDVAGHLAIDNAPHPALRGALHSTGFDLDALTQAPAPAVPAAPTATSPAPAPPGELIPDRPIPYAVLRGLDADLQIEAAALAWRGTKYPQIVAHLALQDGKLRLDPARMTVGDQTLSAQIEADAGPQTIAAKLAAPGVSAGPLSALFGGPKASGQVDLRADLRGQGATWRALAATLQGTAGLAMVSGEVDTSWLLDALRTANLPFGAGGAGKIRCAAASAKVDEGRVQLQTLTLDASKLDVDGAGEIDLVAETLDLHLRPTLRLGAALSVPVRVSGSWRAPKILLDPGALAPGRVGISIGGPPPPDRCLPALALARGDQAGPAPMLPEQASRPLKPADLLRGLLR